ncbi:DUF3693 domain-containing protein [Pseudomonas fluorescens]
MPPCPPVARLNPTPGRHRTRSRVGATSDPGSTRALLAGAATGGAVCPWAVTIKSCKRRSFASRLSALGAAGVSAACPGSARARLRLPRKPLTHCALLFQICSGSRPSR